MDTLALYTKNVMSEKVFDNILDGNDFPTVITDLEVVKQAVQIFKSNIIVSEDNRSDMQRLAEVLRG